MRHLLFLVVTLAASLVGSTCNCADAPRSLRVGRVGHAFDHLGAFGNQAETAAASGATIIYASGVGGLGYEGLPEADKLSATCDSISEYNHRAKKDGIELSIGYICATSIVKLDTFDKNWSTDFRARFKTPPADWRQQDRQGKPLPSWYGGDYQPACMNNPDWRAYEEFIVETQLKTGHDGVFFDNPTVHPKGCYCAHCMTIFATFLQATGVAPSLSAPDGPERIEEIRKLADAHPKDFLRFRCTIARDFLAHMRTFARTINPAALITCNNSLNVPQVFYSQCRSMAYNIEEMSKVEDFVVVEDMATQPRIEANGQTVEYGPMYKQLHAISHGKPVAACTIVGGDYHTAPNLVRLAMAEAVAHNASYLSWPTWPKDQRERMIATIRPQADFLREREELLNDTTSRTDVILFAPFRRWLETDQCVATKLAAALTRANIQYRVNSDDDYDPAQEGAAGPVLLIESRSILSPKELSNLESFERAGGHVVTADRDDWLTAVQQSISHPSIEVEGPPTVRIVVRDQPTRSIIHLYNLDVERLSSFDDRMTPATDITLKVRVPFKEVQSLTIQTADRDGAHGDLAFSTEPTETGIVLKFTVPRLDISALVVAEAGSGR